MEALNHSLYLTAFKRKSTRSYSDAPVDEEKMNGLRAFIRDVVPLLPSQQAFFKIQPHKGTIMKIAAYAKNEAASYINLAFMLQQMDLYIQANGMGALWNATVRAAEKQCEGLPYAICLLFGMAKENPARTSASEFNRKRSDEITNKPELPFIEAVRLAPSARNRQPWYLDCKDRHIDFYCRKGGFLDHTLLKDLHWFDIGISVCHAVLALQQEGFSPTAAVQSNAPDQEGRLYGIGLSY